MRHRDIIGPVVLIGIAALVTAGAFSVTHAESKPFKMSGEDEHHLRETVYQLQLIDAQYHAARDPIAKEQSEIVERNCKKAGFALAECDVHSDGLVVKLKKDMKAK